MALAYSHGMAVGTPAPDFSLPGVDGTIWSLSSFAAARVLVVVFTCNHCPYAVACEDRLIDLQRRHAGRGAALVAINPNDAEQYPEDSFEAMRRRAEEKNFPFPYLHDETQDVARTFDAACTPDVFVFDEERRLRYNGRIDDNWRDPDAVTRKDLDIVIEDLLAGRPVSIEQVPSMGCSIKWKRTM